MAKAKQTKEQTVEAKTLQYVHIDTFLETARVLYSMNDVQVQGFRAYMQGSHYQKGDVAFVPYLEKYLGIGD